MPSYGKDGKTIVKETGQTFNVDNDAGGGVTFGGKNTDQAVYISGNENTSLKDTKGAPLNDKPADILAHELVGHAIPKAAGNTNGNAVVEENKVRAETGNQQRQAEPSHVKCKSCQ